VELSSEVQRLFRGAKQPEEGWENQGRVAAELSSEVQLLFIIH